VKSYSDYSVTVATDASYYGPECRQEEAESLAGFLAELIAEEFAGIRVSVSEMGGPVRGPQGDVCEEIRLWIEEEGFRIAMQATAKR
jgi:hypothetical protein